jgi:protein transport protein HofQ/type IV pilus assembly protein PilQ
VLLFAWLALTPRQAMSDRRKSEVRHRRKPAVSHRRPPAMCRWRRPVVPVRVTEEPPLVVVGPAQAALTVAAPAEVLPANAAPAEKAIEPPAADNKNGLPARGTYRIEGDEKSMSVFAVSVDAQELFTALADRANLRLVIDDQVSRRLTINITNRPARQIIDNITGAYGLAAADVDGVTMISEGIPRSPSSYLLSDIDSISTKYVDASNARNLLPVFLQDYVKVNSEQNAVVLSAPSSVLQKFRDDIAQFDIPASQILVDLLLVELTDTTLDQFGLNFLYQNADKGGEINAGAGSLIFRTVTNLPQQFSVTLRALEQKGQARVRANPRIATVSGRQASIFVGRQRYVVTPIDTGRGQTNYIDAGVRLAITPYTGGQRQVLVDVDTEVSTLSAPDPVTHLPEKSTRTATTTVRVNDGQTIVIGGLNQQESSDIRTRVPGLSHLPLLGPLLFRTKDVRSTNSELVLFITPRILSSTGHLPAAEERALTDRFLQGSLSSASPLPRRDQFELPTPQPHGGIVPSPRGQTGTGDAGTMTPVPGNTP